MLDLMTAALAVNYAKHHRHSAARQADIGFIRASLGIPAQVWLFPPGDLGSRFDKAHRLVATCSQISANNLLMDYATPPTTSHQPTYEMSQR